jgi:hypothetical protein
MGVNVQAQRAMIHGDISLVGAPHYEIAPRK